MTRVLLISWLVLAGFSVEAAEEPRLRKVLFFDLWRLDHWDNVELRLGEPDWVEECEYRDPSFTDRGVYFPSVWIDEESGKWRMVHSVKWSPFTMMAAESDDGIAWRPLPVPDAEVGDGEKLAPNHLLTVPAGSGGGVYRDSETTDGYPFRIFGRRHGEPVLERALADPDHRWHEIARTEGEKRYFGEGITIVSRDGLHWEVKTGGAWDWCDDDWFPEPPVFAFRNEPRGEHVMTARPGWGDRRQCLRTTMDFRTWGDPELQFQPDALDTEGPIGMYGLPVHPVGNGAGYVGLLWIFHNSSSRPVGSFNQFFGTMDAQLVTSYGEVRFQVTDEKSEPIAGFSFDDCVPLRAKDELAHRVAWKEADPATLANRTVRLEIEFRQARIYSLAMRHHFLDAQDKWLLEDGKKIEAKRFDF